MSTQEQETSASTSAAEETRIVYTKYWAPADEAGCTTYWVPVVCENPATLYYMLKGADAVKKAYDSALVGVGMAARTPDWFLTLLSSSRMADFLPSGKRATQLTTLEKKQMNEEHEVRQKTYENSKHPDNDNSLTGHALLNLSCFCGNYMEIKQSRDVPNQNLLCSLCGRTLIHYTGLPDGAYTFNAYNPQKAAEEMAAQKG